MITTYAELQSAIADWLNRSDLTSVIPTFIQLCEKEVKRIVDTRFDTLLDLTLTEAAEGVYTIPGSRPTALKDFFITSPEEYAGKVDPVAPGHLYDHRRTYRHDPSRPVVAAIIDQEIHVSPKPDQDYESQLVIEQPLDELSDTTTTNYVLEHAPDVYLYGSLIQSAPYLKEDDRIVVWKGIFDQAIEQLRMERERQRWPNTPIAPQPGSFGQYVDRHYIYP